MTNLLNAKGIEIVEKKTVRDNLVERVEVLSKVKGLMVLPKFELATSRQVADFYKVPVDTVKSIVKYHREEIESDGYTTMVGKQLLDSLRLNFDPSEIQSKHGKYVVICNGNEYVFANSINALFTKRAILRVGMLLRDSEVAKEVRTQLLNIEEHASEEIKTYEIDCEQELHMKVGKALSEGDMFAFGQAIKELEDYKNRHMIEKAEKWEAFLDDDGTVSLQFVGKKFLDGLSSQKTRERLQSKGVLFMKQTNGAYLPKKGYEKYFFVKMSEYNGVQKNQTRVTREGIDFIVDLMNK